MKKGIAIYGGSFNPPANSHISIANQIIEKIEFIQELVFLPVNIEYGKDELISNEHRYNMLTIICKSNKKFTVSDYELKSKEKNYTIDTLNVLKEKYKKELYFVIGTDNLKEIKFWKEAEELLNQFKLIVVERGNDSFEDIIKEDKFLKVHEKSLIKADGVKTEYIKKSKKKKKEKNKENISQYLPLEIKKYIKDNKLYL